MGLTILDSLLVHKRDLNDGRIASYVLFKTRKNMDQVSLHHPFKVHDVYQLALKVESQVNRVSFKKLGADLNSGAKIKAGSSTQGGKTAVLAHPNTAGGKTT
ncbi:hypothetical protein QYF36_025459 [Acer negundo]|nr:hypothetical protein QYF36_025459 [Acer negundo]